MKVLHLVPAYADRVYSAGHWKACRAMGLLLTAVYSEAATFVWEAEDGSDLTMLEGFVGDVVVEYTRAPELVAAIRRRCPGARIHVRAINAEAWQHLHRSGGVAKALISPRTLYGVGRLLERDSRCRRLGTTILSISPWDTRHYWSWLPGAAPIVDVPYFCPWPDLRPAVRPWSWARRHSSIVCLPGARDRIGRAAARGFYALQGLLSPSLPDWSFRISEGVLKDSQDSAPPAGVERLTDLAEPWDLLCSVKAVAVLTPLGFGAKTTVFDALDAGCHVLVHPKLARRLPAVAREKCVAVDPFSSCDAGRLAALLVAEPGPNDANLVLRAEATRALAAAVHPKQ